MTEYDTARFTLKTELRQRVAALGKQALFPSTEESALVNQIVKQLEDINPIPRPLSAVHLPTLLGNWRLIYASRGTVVTRTLGSLPNLASGINIKRVWQRLDASAGSTISAINGALLELPLLGEWQLQAEGTWTQDADEQVATVRFGAFLLQATQPFGLSSWNLPELKIPVLEFLQNEALWTTSYLDQEIRIGRGVTGNLFVFERE